ncbi:vegetative cell wall protein gp1 [Perca flavescens]|uniref:vegetative cell wall protein gp1 n=1 Tax=Perca flavescens TaxID=8167 RepID=UPI00106DE637|nr:vegetative cell wall protein gp1-like [Perca flavescens]
MCPGASCWTHLASLASLPQLRPPRPLNIKGASVPAALHSPLRADPQPRPPSPAAAASCPPPLPPPPPAVSAAWGPAACTEEPEGRESVSPRSTPLLVETLAFSSPSTTPGWPATTSESSTSTSWPCVSRWRQTSPG